METTAKRPAPASLLAKLDTQPRVRDFLMRAVEGDRTSHAYLFLGAPGSGKLDAAWALAQAIICESHGCASCEACVRVARRTHPDVHYLSPESVTGYLIGQTRDKIAACAKEHGFTEIMYAEDMQEAVQVCAVYADIGDCVLLSPACASWGMFKNYEERGRIFKECVMEL